MHVHNATTVSKLQSYLPAEPYGENRFKYSTAVADPALYLKLQTFAVCGGFMCSIQAN